MRAATWLERKLLSSLLIYRESKRCPICEPDEDTVTWSEDEDVAKCSNCGSVALYGELEGCWSASVPNEPCR